MITLLQARPPAGESDLNRFTNRLLGSFLALLFAAGAAAASLDDIAVVEAYVDGVVAMSRVATFRANTSGVFRQSSRSRNVCNT